jgi:hypothetical protein
VTVVAITILILANIVASPEPGLADAAEACRGVMVRPGEDVERALDAAPKAATVCFGSGIYRPGCTAHAY